MELSEAGRVLHAARHVPFSTRAPTGLALAKLIQQRRRSRIARARQLASNIDVQAHIQRNVDLYNTEAQRIQLRNALGGMGANIPAEARRIHEARLEQLDDNVTGLQQSNIQALAMREIAAPMPVNALRRLRRADQTTMDRFAR